MGVFFARKDKEGNFQLLNDHLDKVSELASSFCVLPKTAELAGKLHDIGKLTTAFQRYLLEGGTRGEVIHSLQGAFVVNSLPDYDNYAKLVKELLSLIIASHHGQLSDLVSPDGEKMFMEKFAIAREDDFFVAEVQQSAILTINNFEQQILWLYKLSTQEMMDFFQLLKRTYNNQGSAYFALGLLIKYIYSCLIDADRLDAYNFEAKEDYLPEAVNWDKLAEVFEQEISKLPNVTRIDSIRAEVSNSCKQAHDRKPDIYHLSVPTGGGKTLSSLRFALHHCKKYNKARIIYVIPYLSIIEQTAATIKSVFSELEENIVLEHHSNVSEDNDDNEGYNSYKRMLSERWDSPIVITTLVQFLETVMASRGGKLRKFHNMQNSVIIFDEIQSLPLHSIHLFNEAVSFLSKALNCTILLCTATQPLLNKTPKHNLLLADNSSLIKDISKEFEGLQRTRLIFENPKDLDEICGFINDKLETSTNILVIVNTKQAAKKLFNKLFNKKPADCIVIHLSTAMCPQHRIDKLNTIKKYLSATQKFICISTQLIEAGVDISFSCVIRFMAGLDSILQAAGRCNRNGKEKTPQNVYVFSFKQENLDKLVDIKKGKEITERLLREHPDGDFFSQEILEKYYNYYFFERKDIMDYNTNGHGTVYSMLSNNALGVGNYVNRKGTNYDNVLSQAFCTASIEYHTIEQNTETVVVDYGDAQKLINQYKISYYLKEKIRLIKELSKYSVSLYQGYEYESLLQAGAIYTLDDEFSIKILKPEYYCLNIGVKTIAEEVNMVI